MNHPAPIAAGPDARPDAHSTAIGLQDLIAFEGAEVDRLNADLAFLDRRIFQLGGLELRFVRLDDGAPTAETAAPPAAWLWLERAGVPLLAGFSAAWAGAWTQDAGMGLDQLSEEALNLLAQLTLSPRLPAGLTLRAAALERDAMTDLPPGLGAVGRWSGRDAATGEPSGHEIQVWGGAGCTPQALYATVAPLTHRVLPPPLAQVPVPLPLVAARWSVDADQLHDLAVGDVLLLD